MEREEEKEAEREEEEVAPEQRAETKHGQEEKKKEVLQALGLSETLPQPLLEAAGTPLYPKGCCSLLRAHTGTGEKREEEGWSGRAELWRD